MKIVAEFEWVETNVIPKGCRKPRSVDQTDSMEIDLNVVSDAEAPLAFRLTEDRGQDEAPVVKEWRWWNGSLWRPRFTAAGQTEPDRLGQENFPISPKHKRYAQPHLRADSIDEIHETLRQYYAERLVVDGVVHEPANEPTVRLFIEGGGRWGTGLSRRAIVHAIDYSHGAGDGERTYSALDADEALRDARDALSAYPGEPSIDDRSSLLEVFLPDAVRVATTPYIDALSSDARHRLRGLVLAAQDGREDDETDALTSGALDALIEAEGWAAARRLLGFGYEESRDSQDAVRAALVKVGIVSESPKVLRTRFTFEVLHPSTLTIEDLRHALQEAWDGGAVGLEGDMVTTPVGDALVPAALRRLGNDGAFFGELGIDGEAAAHVAAATAAQ